MASDETGRDVPRRFIARQPIFDRRQAVFAYELLFRSSFENYFNASDGDRASSDVIESSLLVFGLDRLLGGHRAFVNVTRRVLLEDLVYLLPAARVVVELLEEIQPDAEVLAACRRLKRAGYTIALDDYVHRSDLEPLVALADIVKIDFRATSSDERKRLAALLARPSRLLLA